MKKTASHYPSNLLASLVLKAPPLPLVLLHIHTRLLHHDLAVLPSVREELSLLRELGRLLVAVHRKYWARLEQVVQFNGDLGHRVFMRRVELQLHHPHVVHFHLVVRGRHAHTKPARWKDRVAETYLHYKLVPGGSTQSLDPDILKRDIISRVILVLIYM